MRRVAIILATLLFAVWGCSGFAALRPYALGQRDPALLTTGDRLALLLGVLPLWPMLVVDGVARALGYPTFAASLGAVELAVFSFLVDAGLIVLLVSWWRRHGRSRP